MSDALTNPRSYPANEPGIIAIGGSHFLRPDPSGAYLWWHGCSAKGWRGVGEPLSRHVVTSRHPLTIHGSLLCPVCGAHGYVENGKWRQA